MNYSVCKLNHYCSVFQRLRDDKCHQFSGRGHVHAGGMREIRRTLGTRANVSRHLSCLLRRTSWHHGQGHL
jgi:hypothetical protein